MDDDFSEGELELDAAEGELDATEGTGGAIEGEVGPVVPDAEELDELDELVEDAAIDGTGADDAWTGTAGRNRVGLAGGRCLAGAPRPLGLELELGLGPAGVTPLWRRVFFFALAPGPSIS